MRRSNQTNKQVTPNSNSSVGIKFKKIKKQMIADTSWNNSEKAIRCNYLTPACSL